MWSCKPHPLWRGWLARQDAKVVDSECICSGIVLVQPVYPRPTPPSEGDPHLKIIGSVPDRWSHWGTTSLPVTRLASILHHGFSSSVVRASDRCSQGPGLTATGSLWTFFSSIRHYNPTPHQPAGLEGCMSRVMAYTNEPVLLKAVHMSIPTVMPIPISFPDPRSGNESSQSLAHWAIQHSYSSLNSKTRTLLNPKSNP